MADDYFGIVGTTQAGAYRVEAVVAEGAFGVVYRAYHDAFRAPVALKCLKLPPALNELQRRAFVDRFHEEAALLFQLSTSSPAIVRPLQVDILTAPDGRLVPFLALEWLEGRALDTLVAERSARGLPPLGLAKVVDALEPIARALALAHSFPTERGPISIVHNDIKPEHLFLAIVNGERTMKLFDFGIATARSMADANEGRGARAVIAFTQAYGAPEQWEPNRYGATGPWTDVWALALTVLEVASAMPVFAGTSEQIRRAACDPSTRPSASERGLAPPGAVDEVFRTALAVSPRERYPNAGAFWSALEAALGADAYGYHPRSEDADASGRLGNVAPLELEGFPSERLSLGSMHMRVSSERGGPFSDPSARDPDGPARSVRSPSSIDRRAHGAAPAPLREPSPGGASRRPPIAVANLGERVRGMRAGEIITQSPLAPPFRAIASRLRIDRASTGWRRYAGPTKLLGVGLALLAIDRIYANMTGSLLALGPLRMTWVAGLLALAGVAILVRELLVPPADP